MRLIIITALLVVLFNKQAEAQYPCDIATTGVGIVNATNTAPVSSICVGQHANFKFSLANLGTSPACVIPANSVTVTFDFPTLAGNVKPYIYAGPANFVSGYFSWTYNAGAEVLVGTNTTPIPNGLGDADILVDVIGNTAQAASSNLNITQGMGISDNTANNTGSAQLTVNASPTVTCPANMTGICTNTPSFPLTGGSPAGGTYTGPGVSANNFNPATAGVGIHTITYTYNSAANGCAGSCTFTITVSSPPTVTCPSNMTGVCSNAPAFPLTGATPAGGTYSGTGVSANNFDPATAGPGTHTITYTYSSGGCTSTCSFTITVVAAPTVTCRGNITNICTNTPAFALTGGTPGGGTFSGPGVTANNFDPAVAGAGTHTITYSVTSGGCTSTCTFTITVTAAPVVTCPGNMTGVCSNAAAFPLTGGSPVGGTYSGTGVTANNFNPATAGVGTHTITYSVTAGGCTSTCTFTISVVGAPSITCRGNITNICTNTAPFALTGGAPGGGTYSGPGVSANNFNPATAGVGVHTITYSVSSGGCTSTCTFTITVDGAPVVTCPSNMTACLNSPAFPLTGGNPAGGTYSGPGVSANNFNPGTAGAGIHTITYSFTNQAGCSASCTFTITVTNNAVVTCPSNITGICTNSGSFPLTGGSPAGGTYSGPGVSSNTFNPATAGVGTHTITYSQGAGCPGSCTFTITVTAPPTVSCPNNITGICTNGNAFAMTGGLPAGGSYSGTGVSANNFNPATAGQGTHTITYSVTQGGCTSSCTFTITVNTPPNVTCPSNTSACVNQAPFALTGGSPVGGNYSGPGVSANNFNPSAAGIGTHTITYTYTSTATGCTNTCTFTINVTSVANVTCPQNMTGICVNTNPFPLTGGAPAGGTYTGPGVSSNTFNPGAAGVGTHTISYTLGGPCSGTCTFTITVDAQQNVSCPQPITGVCTNSPAFALTGGSPGGGTYTGPGVSANNFNPATAGAGIHTISYTVTSGGCTSTCTFTISVSSPAPANCPNNMTVCSNAASFTLGGASPAGGNYSGPGVSGNVFSPATAGAGVHTITYTPAPGCATSCTFTITVQSCLVVSCPNNMVVCSTTPTFALTGGTPAGGTYTGPGVTANNFNPGAAGAGTHIISYTVGGPNAGTCSFSITVNAVSGTVSGGAVVSASPSSTTIIFTGSGSGAPAGTQQYRFAYSLNTNNGGFVPQGTVTGAIGSNTANVFQSNAVSGSYVYRLDQVTDLTTGCSSPANLNQTTTVFVTAAVQGPGTDITLVFSPYQSLNFQVAGSQNNFGLNMINIGANTTSGTMIIRIPKTSAFTLSLPNVATMNGNPVNNGDWTLTSDFAFWILTSNLGVVIGPSGSSTAGINVVRNSNVAPGTVQPMTATLQNGTGSDNNTNNNTVTVLLTAQ